VIYVDSSVALAHLLDEERSPPQALWQETIVSSRLLEYEVWTRIHARNLTRTHAESARSLIGHIDLIELTAAVLARATAPFPVAVRTLDALHLASMEHLRSRGKEIELASYDHRLLAAAEALSIKAAAL
jgi:predicted nucleic acid-binding protein